MNLELREIEFGTEVYNTMLKIGVVLGSAQMANDFISYWTEPNKSKTKMRFELEKTWDTKRRLQTWIRNDKKFNPQKETETIKKMPGNYLKGNHFKERQSNSEPKKISELIKK